MEPLTAIVTLVGRFGVQELVGALSGRPELGALASDLVGALSASESRLSAQLADIERRLDQLLDQRYEAAIGSGLRCLLDAGTSGDKRARTEELNQARQHFRHATAAATSSLQRAIAERYLLICTLALNRHDAAKTAWAELNSAMTTAALEVSSNLPAPTIARWRGKRHDAGATAEAAGLVERLFAESGVLGQVFGHPPPPPIRRLTEPATIQRPDRPSPLSWTIDHTESREVQIGALTLTWGLFSPKPARPHDPVRGDPHLSQGFYQRPSHVVDVHLSLQVDADPPLSRDLEVSLHAWGKDPLIRRLFASTGMISPVRSEIIFGPRTALLAAGTRSCETSGALTLAADHHGNLLEPVEARIGCFVIHRRQ